MQPPVPAPSATGSFAKTPFPHLLVYALERRLSGTFELVVEGQSAATMLVIQGFPAKLRTTEGVHYLGEVMLSLGLISAEQLAASLEQMQSVPRLQGQLLMELGAADEARIEHAVRVQLDRKIEHLFSLPQDATFAYYDGVDALQRYGGPPTPIDPFPVLWRGIRQSPPREHVDAALRRIAANGLRLVAGAQIERSAFLPNEAQTVELLRHQPLRVVDIANAQTIPPDLAHLLVYFLVITKQVDLIEASARPAPPQPRPAAPPPAPSSAANMTGPNSGQAFARVQLQPRQISRQPLVVEEVHTAMRATDDRISNFDGISPPAPEVAVVATNPMDIGAMITSTIQSSLPPPGAPPSVIPGAIPTPGTPLVPIPPPSSSQMAAASPPPPPHSSGSIPAAPSSSPRLTAEQSSLKMKILERAEQITGQNYFQMLNVDQDATAEQVQKSFFALAKVWHPDRLPPALVDVKDACSKVFSHLTEAHATLTDAKKRNDYMTLVREGGATPDDQGKIQTILEAATEFQKAEILLKRNPSDPQAAELVKRAVALDPEQADYMALHTWLEAQLPMWLSREKTLEKIAMLDRCLKKNDRSARAYFYRGMLYKRIDEGSKAVRDFKKASELDPRNLDALREVRLHNMRGGTKPPPGMSGAPARTSKKPEPETLGGLFGKLFKK